MELATRRNCKPMPDFITESSQSPSGSWRQSCRDSSIRSLITTTRSKIGSLTLPSMVGAKTNVPLHYYIAYGSRLFFDSKFLLSPLWRLQGWAGGVLWLWTLLRIKLRVDIEIRGVQWPERVHLVRRWAHDGGGNLPVGTTYLDCSNARHRAFQCEATLRALV